MKKIVKTIMVIILLLIISCNNTSFNNSTSVSSETNKSFSNKFINVGIYVYDYPFGYLSNGTIGGFDYDLMNEISKISSIKMNFIPMQFEQLMPALEAKKIDAIIAGMTVTEDRKKQVNFSDKYYTSRQAILLNQNEDKINTEEDLIGKKVGVIRGTIADTIISQNPGIQIERFETGSSILLSLKVGKVDAAMFDKVTCDHYLSYDKDIKLAEGITFPEENYAIAFRKDETALLNEINKALSEVMNNGSYNTLIQKHLGTNQSTQSNQ